MNPIIYGLIVTLFGMTIVFLVLIALWGILAMMKLFFGGNKKQIKNPDNIESSLVATAEITAANPASEELDGDELIAAISAAIYACMGSQSNIIVRKITRVGDSTPIWGQLGRHEQTLNRL